MSDGMTAAQRESDLAHEETRIACELLRCLKNPHHPRVALLTIAEKADDIRIPHGEGHTSYRTSIEKTLEKLRAGDETVWARRLQMYTRGGAWVNDSDNKSKVVNLYDEFKALSPFKNAVLIFGTSGSGELQRAMKEALTKNRFSSSEDDFMFVLTSVDPIEMRPVWIRATSFSPSRSSSSPWIAPE